MNHKDFDVYKKSIQLVKKVYLVTDKLPSKERFALVQQINRSAISVPSNIAEGAARVSTKEYIRFLNIANGSLSELETQLFLVKELNYLDATGLIDADITDIRKMLFRLKQSLSKRS